jgi:hypothetical protein
MFFLCSPEPIERVLIGYTAIEKLFPQSPGYICNKIIFIHLNPSLPELPPAFSIGLFL